MSMIQLDGNKKQQWRKAFRALLRRCGKQQQEVAIDMARIVSALGKPVDDHAFISSLSRFANGKDSAFPGWLYKEETRLNPMAQAMGLSSSQEIWDIIHSLTQNQPKRDVWHAAFPGKDIEIPILLNGKSIESTARQIYKKSKQTSGVYSVWVCGPRWSGKTYAVQQLRRELVHLEQNIEEGTIGLQIHEIEDRNHDSDRAQQSFSMPYWGKREFELLLDQLQGELDPSQNTIGRAFVEKYDELHAHLQLYAHDAIFFFRMMIDGGLSRTQKEVSIRLMKYFWSLSMEKGFALISLSFEDWTYIWGGIFSVAWATTSPSLSEIQNVLKERCASFALLDRGAALKKIHEMTEAPKKERQRLALEVSRWLVQSSSAELLELFEEENLLIKEAESRHVPFKQRMMLWASHCYVQNNMIELPHAYLLHQDWPKFLRMMMVLELSKETLCQWLDAAPSFLCLEIYLVRLRYALHVDGAWTESELVDIWIHVLYAEYHQLYMVREDRDFERSESLIAFSKKYAQILPQLSYDEPMRDILSLLSSQTQQPIVTEVLNSYRPIQALAPYQIPPKTYMQWKMWKRISHTGPKAWEVLSYFAHEGEVWAQRLLSEGDGSSSAPWIYAPVEERMFFVGRSDIRVETKRAMHNICVDIWQNKPQNESSWEPDTAEHLLEACLRCGFRSQDLLGWVQISSIAQQIIRYRQPFLAYCSIWFLYKTGHHEELERIYTTIQQWCQKGVHIEDGMLQHSGLMIPMGKSSKEEVQQELQILLLRTAEVLYLLGELQFVFEIWKSNRFALEQKAFDFLVRHYDRNLLLHWLSLSPTIVPSVNQSLCSDSKYLRLAWRLDRKGKRKKELYSFALTYDSLPQWALQDAQKTLLESGVWPQWLSPHRVEVQEMLIGLAKKTQGRHKLWFGAMIHRHMPNHPIFLSALKKWALEDENPLSYSSIGGQSYLSAVSSPLHSSLELVQLLLSLSDRPSWFFDACCRLWQLAKMDHEKIALRLLFVLEELEAFTQLFSSNWFLCSPNLQKELIKIWMKRQNPSSIINMYWKEPSIRPFLQKKMLSLREPQFMAWLKSDFAEHLTNSSFALLLEGIPDEVPELLTEMCHQNMEKRDEVLLFVQRYLLRHHHLELLLWFKEEVMTRK